MECHRVHLVHRLQVFLSGVVGACPPGEAASYSVDNLSVTSSIGLPRGVVPSGGIVPCGLSVVSVIPVISTALRLPRPLGWIRPAVWVSVIPDEPAEMPSLDKFLDLILQGLTLLGPVFWWYRHCFVRSALFGLATFLGGGINAALRVSSRIFPLSVVKSVYLENWIGRSRLSRCWSFL